MFYVNQLVNLGMKVTSFLVALSLLLTSSLAIACSCKKETVEDVAHLDRLSLIKMKIRTPSVTERVNELFSAKQKNKNLNVQILDNFKGAYPYNVINVLTDKDDDCSVKFKYGDDINVIIRKDDFGNTKSNATITSCDIVSDEFTFKVKAEKQSPKISYASVNTDTWLNLGRADSRTFFADTRTVKKDANGAYIWVLMNDAASRIQSQKQLMHVSCADRKFAIDVKIQFSQANAMGSVLYIESTNNHTKHEWANLTNLYSKLLAHTCS